MSLTALLLAGALLGLAGCRRPAPMMPGWVRLAPLVSLHPDREMATDLLHRIQELQAQRARILGHAQPALPPDSLEEPVPNPIALAAPHPSPPFDWQTDRYRAELLTARTRVLTNQLHQDEVEFRRQRDQQYNTELAAGVAELEQTKHQSIQKIRDASAHDLQNALLALDLAQFNLTKHPTSKYFQQKLDTARKHLLQLQRDIKAATDRTDDDLLSAKICLQQQLQAKLQDDLARQQDKRQRACTEQCHAVAADIALQLAKDPEPSPLPALDLSAHPQTPQSLDLSTLPPQAHTSATRISRERAHAVQEIDHTIAELELQLRQLHARLTTETRAAVAAVAAQHGYQVRFSATAGDDITAQTRNWLHEYWTGR